MQMNWRLRKFNRVLCGMLVCILVLMACAPNTSGENISNIETESQVKEDDWHERALNVPDDQYRTFYEIFVYSFYDSNGDGIGDLNGVTEKLDYLTELGVNGIWLMPVMPSTTYHKYDTTNYMGVDSEYGTMEDFERLIEECHARGIRVIIDLAMNHSSSKNQWFLEAADYLKSLPQGAEPDASQCKYLEYYNFTKESGSGYSQVAGTDWYYEARFWSEMPDLNLENENVRKEFEAIAKFWIEKGVDGFRLDAVKEFVSGAQEANIEILSWFNDYVKSVAPESYIVCECWMDRIYYSQYYASDVNSMFAFDFADKSGIIANVVNGKSSAASYGKALVESAKEYASYNEDYIDAPFYTNHDMGRSAGYYAGDNSAAQTKIGNAMNILMSGNVFIYYGEELGMKGAGADENKRAPMYWSKDANADGMCNGPKDMDDVKMKFNSFAEQVNEHDSIYNYVKDAILIRNQNPEIARGVVTFYEEVSNDNVCVITKAYEGNEILLVFNISPESVDVVIDGIMINGSLATEQKVLGKLLSGTEDIVSNENGYTMPAYSILVIGQE